MPEPHWMDSVPLLIDGCSFNVYSERSIVMEPVHISNVVVLHVNNLWVQVIAFQA